MKTLIENKENISQVKKEWFSDWFDSPYYHILYKNRDDQEAQFFIDNLSDFLGMTATDKVLDLACGKGRHSIYLNRKGLNVVGVDLSKESIAFAHQYENERLRFAVHDMRQVFSDSSFDFILNLFTSFGYFDRDEENLQAIKAATANLKPNGRLVIDFLNPRKVIQEMISYEVKEIEDIVFHIHKEVKDNFIIKSIKFEDNHQHYHFEERVKAIYCTDFKQYFKEAGLELLHTFGDYQLSPYHKDSSERMIFVVEKL